MKDFLGTELGPGDKVVYPIRNGGSLKNERGIVTGLSRRGDKECVVVVRTDYSNIVEGHHERPELLTVVGTAPVVCLDPLKQAMDALRDAKDGYYAHTVSLDDFFKAKDTATNVFNEVWG